MQYAVEIKEMSTGRVARVPCPGLGWHDKGSPFIWNEKTCDCVLQGFYQRKGENTPDKWDWSLDRNVTIPCVVTMTDCRHVIPTQRYKALRAFIADGRVVELAAV